MTENKKNNAYNYYLVIGDDGTIYGFSEKSAIDCDKRFKHYVYNTVYNCNVEYGIPYNNPEHHRAYDPTVYSLIYAEVFSKKIDAYSNYKIIRTIDNDFRNPEYN